ncbi:hypothetical protein [Polaribacter ponticola]|uniref:Protein-tyrosine-phosphatase n=1 Tax=Polaribacter ponticola TaxID=2978475 RepID=A0ABT5S8F6_9FLAO|nr:hypothetical protein [Polaribacter sp. MSW5]MDD7914397.1 hypothetical protein [Polaribacter sp. MSW5]
MLKTPTITTKKFFEHVCKNSFINNERKSILLKVSKAIINELRKNGVVNINFICTNNSRRSQFGQIWSYFIAEYYNLNINSFSGGIDVTALHRNTIKTLQKAGFTFQLTDFSHQNPKYQITFEGSKESIIGFSKLYYNPINNEPFIAITTSNSANKNCPLIPKANYRFHLPFIDPKSSDRTKLQKETYLNTSKQIAAEINFIFFEVKKMLF